MPSFTLRELLVLPDKESILAYFASLLASLAFAMAFTFVHKLYHRGANQSPGMERSFLLIGPAVTAIFLVIQFSLPLSLGLLGALSFVRFRTPVKEPEEIGFLLLLIGTALCCAVFRFEVAVALTAVGAGIAMVRNASSPPWSWLRSAPPYEMFVTSSKKDGRKPFVLNEVLEVLRSVSAEPELLSVSEADSQISYHLRFRAKGKTGPSFAEEISSKLDRLESVSNVNLIFHAT